MIAAAATLRRWRLDPIAFVREVFGVEPDAWQAEALAAFPNKQRIALKASKGPGKSTVLAWCAWNFMATRPHPNVIVTSVTGDNLQDGLWKELSKWQQKSELLKSLFEYGKTRIVSRQHPETWFMSARTWPRNADPAAQSDALAGIHGEYTLFLLDESGSIPDAVMTTAEASLSTGTENKIMQAGNPTELSGPLYRACTTARELWHVITISGAPNDPKRSPRVSLQWAQEMIREHGEDNPWVQVNVFGNFPAAAFNSLIGPDAVEAVQTRVLPRDRYEFSARVLGVDVARFGDDRTVVFGRQGLYAKDAPLIMMHQRTEVIAGAVARKFDDEEYDHIFVDDCGGYGSGVIDALLQLGYPVTGANSSSQAFNPRYFNKRAEMAFEAAEWVKSGASLWKDTGLLREAVAARYFYRNNRLQIVDKGIIKADLGRSPDVWDAFCLTFYSPVNKMERATRLRREAGLPVDHKLPDYDPYAERAA